MAGCWLGSVLQIWGHTFQLFCDLKAVTSLLCVFISWLTCSLSALLGDWDFGGNATGSRPVLCHWVSGVRISSVVMLFRGQGWHVCPLDQWFSTWNTQTFGGALWGCWNHRANHSTAFWSASLIHGNCKAIFSIPKCSYSEHLFWARLRWIQILALPLTSCKTLGVLHLCVPQFPQTTKVVSVPILRDDGKN